jgi:hypothetical protein
MLSPDTAALLTEAASHLRREHEAARGNDVRQFKLQMVQRGTVQSSMFHRGISQIYYEAFEKYATGVWREMQRVLEQIGFDAYAGCEEDLIDLLKASLAGAYKAAKSSLSADEKPRTHTPEATFDIHHEAVCSKLATEIKVFARKVRAMKQKERSQAITQNNYYLHGPSSRVNIGSTDHSVNIITEQELFSKLREAVEAQVSDPSTKARLLEKIKEGKGLPKKSPIFNNWFTHFLALADDCITVFQLFIPALTQLLAQHAA